MLLLGLVSWTLLSPGQINDLFVYAAILIILLVFSAMIFVVTIKKKSFQWLVNYLPGYFLKDKLKSSLSNFNNTVKRFSFSSFLEFLLFSIFVWTLYHVGFFLLFLSIDLHLGLLQFLSCIALVMLVQSLPITFLGIGTRETALLLYLGNFGVDSPTAISISFLFLAAVIFTLLISLGFWFFKNSTVDDLMGGVV